MGYTSYHENLERDQEEQEASIITKGKMMDQQSAYEIVSEGVRKRLERAFWEVDDVVVALAPDTPPEVMDAWTALHKAMTPEFIARRDRLRGKP